MFGRRQALDSKFGGIFAFRAIQLLYNRPLRLLDGSCGAIRRFAGCVSAAYRAEPDQHNCQHHNINRNTSWPVPYCHPLQKFLIGSVFVADPSSFELCRSDQRVPGLFQGASAGSLRELTICTFNIHIQPAPAHAHSVGTESIFFAASSDVSPGPKHFSTHHGGI